MYEVISAPLDDGADQDKDAEALSETATREDGGVGGAAGISKDEADDKAERPT